MHALTHIHHTNINPTHSLTQFSNTNFFANFFIYLNAAYRPRQNSVFVGPQFVSQRPPPRKSRSAVDIHSLVVNEKPEPV